jgi:hypothetical protein
LEGNEKEQCCLNSAIKVRSMERRKIKFIGKGRNITGRKEYTNKLEIKYRSKTE